MSRARRRGGPIGQNQTAAAMQKQMVGLVLEKDVPLFPLLLSFEARHFRYLVLLGLIFDVAQVVAFGGSIHRDWSPVAKGVLKVPAFFHLPLYDPLHLSAPWAVSVAVVGIAAVLLATIASSAVYYLLGVEDDDALTLPKPVTAVCKTAVHSLSTWAYVPAMNVACSLCFCGSPRSGTDPSRLFWFRDEECSSAVGVTVRVVAITTMVLLTVLAFFAQSMFFDINPSSRHYWARPHTLLDGLHVGFRCVAVVVFHCAMARQHALWYDLFVLVAATLVAASFAVVMPYLRHTTQSLRVGSYLVAALWAALSALSQVGVTLTGEEVRGSWREWWEWARDRHMDLPVVLLLIPAGLALGHLAAFLRVSSVFREHLALLKDGRIAAVGSLFPANLPARDEYFTEGADLEKHFPLPEDEEDDLEEVDEEEEGAPQAMQAFHFTTPYLDAVQMPTDVELATRFIQEYEAVTDLEPTTPMLAFTARLLLRGRRRFDVSRQVWLGYISFLFHQAKNHALALLEMNALRSVDTPLPVRYQVWKMQGRTELLLHVNKSSRGTSAATLKRRHREVLQAIGDFWFLLTSEEFDPHALAVTTASVIGYKEECTQFYRKLLTKYPNNVDFVAMYVKYCEDVLQDSEAASQTRQCLTEVLEMKAARATRGARKKRDGKDTLTPLPLDVDSQQNEALAFSAEVVRIRTTTAFACLTTLAVIVVLAAIYVVLSDRRVRTLESVFYSGRLRSMALEASATAQNYAIARLNPAAPAVEIQAKRRAVLAMRDDIAALQHALTFGDNQATTKHHRDFVRDPTLYLGPYGPDTPVSFWSLGRLLPEALQSVADNPTLANVDLPFMMDLPHTGGAAFNRSVSLYVEDAGEMGTTSLLISMAILVAAVVVSVGSFGQLLSSLSTVTRIKTDILQLFTYIRRDRLRSLYQKSKKRNAVFELFLSKKPKEKTEILLHRESADLGAFSDADAPAVAPDEPAAEKPAAPSSPAFDEEDAGPEPSGWRWAAAVIVCCVLSAGLVMLHVASHLELAAVDQRHALSAEISTFSRQSIRRIDHVFYLTRDFVATGSVRRHKSLFASDAPVARLPNEADQLRALMSRAGASGDVMRRLGAIDKQIKTVAHALHCAATLTLSAVHPAWATDYPVTTDFFAQWTTRLALDDIVTPTGEYLRPHAALRGYDIDTTAVAPHNRTAVARSIVFGDHIREARHAVESAIRTLCEEEAAVLFEKGEGVRTALQAAAVGVSCALILVAAVAARRTGLLARKSVSVAAVLCTALLLAAIAGLALSAVALNRELTHRDTVAPVQRLQQVGFTKRLHALTDDARGYTLDGGDQLRLLQLQKSYDAAMAARALVPDTAGTGAAGHPSIAWVYLGALTDLAAHGVDLTDTELLGLEEALGEPLLHLSKLVSVGVRLTYAAVPPTVPFLNATTFLAALDTWDFNNEHDRVAAWAEFSAHDAGGLRIGPTEVVLANETCAAVISAVNVTIDPTAGDTFDNAALQAAGHYSTTALDLALPEADQRVLAANAVLGARFETALEHVEDALWAATRRWRLEELRNERDGAKKEQRVVDVALAVAAVAFVVAVAVGAASVLAWVQAQRAVKRTRAQAVASGGGDEGEQQQEQQEGGGGGGDDGIASRLVEPGLLTVLLVVCLLAAAGLVVFDNVRTKDSAVVVDSATYREYLVSAPLVESARMVVLPSYTPLAKLRLAKLLEEIAEAVPTLYFARGESYVGLGDDGTQRDLLFRERTAQEAVAAFATPAVGTAGGTCGVPDSYFLTVPSSQTATAAGTLGPGLALSFDVVWRQQLRTLIAADTAAQIAAAHNAMLQTSAPLLRGLAASSAQYHTHHAKVMKDGRTFVLLAAGVAALVVLVYFFVVMLRFAAAVHREEASARTMLQLIPADIVEETPRIMAFIEHGTEKPQVDSESAISEAISNMTTLPVIAIDTKGKILKFTSAAEKAFGYSASEVTGLNVKLLMPPEIADAHDGFLSRYERTRVKHVVDQVRRSRGQRKNGEVFPIELSVREVELNNERVFIGFARDMSETLQLGVQDSLNKYVLEMSEAPIIAIDGDGTMLMVNLRATQVFGYAKHEMLRENVKILMPSETALQHDGYLQRYRETGVKRVVDNTRQLTAQRKSGETFQAQLTVREIKGTQIGEQSTFVAYVVDITKEHEAALQNEINDLISDLSPIPIVAINDDGTILKFSRAASKLFGYPADELVRGGENIQLLVPPRYGDHDQYMARYRKDHRGTGAVGTTRKVQGMKRNRTMFPAELTLKEVCKEGTPPVFIAYIRDVSDSVQSEASHTITNAAVEFSMVPVITIDGLGTVRQFNEAATATFGFTADEVVDHNIKMLMPDNVAERHDGYLQRYHDTRVKTVIDRTRFVLGRRKSGQHFSVELNIREVPSSDGSSLFIGYARDVTQRRDMMRQHIINEVVSDLSMVPIIGIDADGRIQTFSRAAEDTFGYNALEVTDQNVNILMTQAVAEGHDGYLKRFHALNAETGLAAAASPIIDKLVLQEAKRKDGRVFFAELSVREIKRPNDRSAFVGFVRDTSQDGVLEEETQLGMTVRNLTSIPIVQVSTDGVMNYVNASAATMFGYAEAEMVGQNVALIMPKAMGETHDMFMLQHLKGKGRGIVGNTRRVPGTHRDGRHIDLELTLGEVKSESSKLHFFVAYLRDVAEQIELERANQTINVITDLSTVPILAIDSGGAVIKYSRAAQEVFQHASEDVLGKNIKMLMPQHIADKHDSYLKTYVRTGIKSVIDNIVRQQGMRRGGALFPMDLHVKEIESDGGQRLFVAYCRDATEDTVLERTAKLADAVSEMSSTPIITISRRGIVQGFNKAAVSCFLWEADDIIGRNIKLLMPQDVAKYHDKFLATYAKTRIKNVIDQLRRVTGLRRDGTTFPAQLSIQEVIPSSGVKDAVYVGFVLDLTAKLEKLRAGMVNDAIVDISHYPLITMDRACTVMRFSESAERCFGYRAEEVLGRNVNMLMPPETAKQHDGYIARYMAKQRRGELTVERTVRPQRKNGDVFQARIFVRELRSDDGSSLLVGYVQDISDKFEMMARSAMGDAAVALSSVPIISIDLQGYIRKFNPAAEGCFGYSAKEAVGENVKMLMPGSVAANHDGYLQRYRETGVKHILDTNNDITAKRKDGTTFPAVISVREVKSKDQHFFIGYVEDRSRLAVFQHATRVNAEIVSCAPTPFVVIDHGGTVEQFNPAAQEMWGYTAAEVVGHNISMLMPEPFRAQHDGYLARYFETGEARVLGRAMRNLHAERKDGTKVAIELFVTEVKTADGVSFVGSCRDISAELRREADRAIAAAGENGSLRALITIDEVGTIERANEAAGKLFRYDPKTELIGQNIKMLMPPDVSAHHDGYLRRYRETGVKTVIDTERRVTGRTKAGERIEVNLNIREVTVGERRSFIAYLENVRAQEVLNLAPVLNSTLLELLPSALIVIDAVGTVEQFNRAAEELFEFSARQVVGKNVKILMTEQHQAAHDGYLEAYRQTGVKHVVDTTRTVTAETKSGRELTIELQVREIPRARVGGDPNDPEDSIFVGFVTPVL